MPSDSPIAPAVRRHLGKIAAGLLMVAVLAYPVGMGWVHKIDDDPAFEAKPPANGSRSVAAAAGLVAREMPRWTPNDPIFQPGWALDNMPHFQQGLKDAVARFAVELADQLGRSRGSSEVDPDLDRAAGLLKYPGTVWMFDPSTSWAPTASSEKQYKAAIRALESYNIRLGAGQATLERRADNLAVTLDRISKDLGAATAAIHRHLAEDHWVLADSTADDLFYGTKGRLYAYSIILRELGWDYAQLLSEKELGGIWREMTESLAAGARLEPLVVLNGAPDATFLPSHLAAQGFYVSRARTQMNEVTDILIK